MIEHHSIPRHDVFSWTMPNQPWVLYQWLFEVFEALVLRIGGVWLVGLIAYLSAGLLVGYILPRSWLRKGVPSWVTFAALILTLNLVWFYVRPQIASFFFIALFLAILERHRNQSGARLLWALPPLMVLWTNLHSFWFIGLLAVLCYAIFAAKGTRRQLWSVLGLCMLAVLVNPYGFGVVSYNLSFIHDADFSGLGELRPPWMFNTLETHLFLMYCLAAWLLLVAKRRRVPPGGLLFGLICTAAALRFARFMPVAVLGTWPFVGMALATFDWQGKYTRLARMPYGQWVHLGVALCVPIVIWMIVVPNEQTALAALTYSRAEGLNFVATHKVPGERLYNDEQTGAQMLFLQLGQVFIDNRFDMYGKSFCDDWLKASHALPGWQAYLDKYGINAIAIAAGQDLGPTLMRDPNWLLAYDDNHLSYWLKNTAANQKILDEWQVSPNTVANSKLPPAIRTMIISDLFTKYSLQGDAFENAKDFQSAADQFREVVAVAPDSADARQKLIHALSAVVANAPDSADARHNLIHALALAGNREQLSAALRSARPFFWKFAGEKGNHRDVFTSQEQVKIDTWVEKATKELMEKYHPKTAKSSCNEGAPSPLPRPKEFAKI